ncbi:MAG: glycosyltransferase family 2 protein [Dehalococcoidia bacterium]
MTDAPLVSVVILNWNGIADTRECLESLKSVSYPHMRIILVDNGSENDEAGKLDSEFGEMAELIRSDENLGFAGGANLGIRQAMDDGAEYVLLLNNDTIVDPEFLSRMVDSVRPLPDFAAACPTAYFHGQRDVIYSTGGSVSLWRGSARQIGRGKRMRAGRAKIVERDYADGVCMLMSRAAIGEVGLLDEDYFSYWEETDWCARAREIGLKCYYVPDATVWHKAARSREPDAGFQYLYRRNALMFVRKRGTALQFASALVTHVLFFGPFYLLKHPTKIARIIPEAKALLWHASNRPRQRSLG